VEYLQAELLQMDTLNLALCHTRRRLGWRRREEVPLLTKERERIVDHCITYAPMEARFQAVRNFGRLESLILDRCGMSQRGINLSIDVNATQRVGSSLVTMQYRKVTVQLHGATR
jgi:hypothetical protein